MLKHLLFLFLIFYQILEGRSVFPIANKLTIELSPNIYSNFEKMNRNKVDKNRNYKFFYEPLNIANSEHIEVAQSYLFEYDSKNYNYKDGLLYSVEYLKHTNESQVQKATEYFNWEFIADKPVLICHKIEYLNELMGVKYFEYDLEGQLILEKTWGCFLKFDNLPINLSENIEANESKKKETQFLISTYEYDEKTANLTSRIDYYEKQIIRSCSYSYDENGAQVREEWILKSKGNYTRDHTYIRERVLSSGNCPGICGIIDEQYSSFGINKKFRNYFVYNSKKELKRQDVFDENNELLFSWIYSYDNDNQLINKKCLFQKNSNKNDFIVYYEYNDNNVIKEKFEYVPNNMQFKNCIGSHKLFPINKTKKFEPNLLVSPSHEINFNNLIDDIDNPFTSTGDLTYDSEIDELWDNTKLKIIKGLNKPNHILAECREKHLARFYIEVNSFQINVWEPVWNKIEEDITKLYIEIEKFVKDKDYQPDFSNSLRNRISIYSMPTCTFFITSDVHEIFSFLYEELQKSLIRKKQLRECIKIHKRIRDKELEIQSLVNEVESQRLIFLNKLRNKDPFAFDHVNKIQQEYNSAVNSIQNEALSEFIEEANKLEAYSEEAALEKAKVAFSLGDYNNSLSFYNEAIGLMHENGSIGLDENSSSNIFYERGYSFEQNEAYDKAIADFNTSLEFNPYNTNAYLERATINLELGQYQEALRDYLAFQSADDIVLHLPIESRVEIVEFGNGLLKGCLLGMKQASQEFIPSLLKTPGAVKQFIWAVAESNPPEWIASFAAKTYDYVRYIANLDKKILKEKAIYTFYELANHWETTSSFDKGKLIGEIVGKYGIDVFGTSEIFKVAPLALKKFNLIKQTNTLAIFNAGQNASTPQAKLDLIKSMYSQHYMNQALDPKYRGIIIAGSGQERQIDDIKRLIKTYGGKEKDWVKKKTETYYLKDIFNNPISSILINDKIYKPVISCHWYENIRTGKRFEYKIKFLEGINN